MTSAGSWGVPMGVCAEATDSADAFDMVFIGLQSYPIFQLGNGGCFNIDS
jgi:hypothetical protein